MTDRAAIPALDLPADTGEPDAKHIARIASSWRRLNQEPPESGSWVFTGGLHPAGSGTVVRAVGMVTDGLYVEGRRTSVGST